MPRGDFSCKFAYKIDVNFYKTIIATIYVTIILTKLRMPDSRTRNSCWPLPAMLKKLTPWSVHDLSARIIGKDNRQFNRHVYLSKKKKPGKRDTERSRLNYFSHLPDLIWPYVLSFMSNRNTLYMTNLCATITNVYIYECRWMRICTPARSFIKICICATARL